MTFWYRSTDGFPDSLRFIDITDARRVYDMMVAAGYEMMSTRP